MYIHKSVFIYILKAYKKRKFTKLTMPGKSIPIAIRELIVRDRNAGKTIREISNNYEVSVGGVEHIVNKFQTHKTVENLSGRGRKRLTTEREDRKIVRLVKANPKLSSRNVVETLGLTISMRTVRRRFAETGLISRYAVKRPFISKKNKKLRFEFANKYKSMPVSYWKQVLWTDESKFELFGRKRRAKVWRKSNESLKEGFTQSTVKHGGGSIMVWGCFAWSGVGNLAKIDGIMTADSYIDILNENLEESLLKTGLDQKYIFQQDNDPKHKAKKTTTFMNAIHMKRLEWPPQSADLNPIENLWGYLDGKVDKTNVTNKDSYFSALEAAWANLDPDYLKRLVESMPRRLAAVAVAKGGHTKY